MEADEVSKSPPSRTLPGRAAKYKRNYCDSTIDEEDDFRPYKLKKCKKELPDIESEKDSFKKICDYINYQLQEGQATGHNNNDEDIIVVEDEKKEMKIDQLYWSVES